MPTSFFSCIIFNYSVQFSSVTQSCPTLWDPMDCSTPGLPVHHQFPEFTQTDVHWVRDAIQPPHPLLSPLLLPSIFPSSRVFSNESVLRIRWPKYRSFSFSTSSSNEYSGMISFRMDRLDLLLLPVINAFPEREINVSLSLEATFWLESHNLYSLPPIFCYLTCSQPLAHPGLFLFSCPVMSDSFETPWTAA